MNAPSARVRLNLASCQRGDRIILRAHPKTPSLYAGTVCETGQWPEVEKERQKWGFFPGDVLCIVPASEMPQEYWRSSA